MAKDVLTPLAFPDVLVRDDTRNNLNAEILGTAASFMVAHEAESDPHPQYANLNEFNVFASGIQTFASSSASIVNIDPAVGSVGDLVWRSGGVKRWALRKSGLAETGGNVGSAFQLKSYADNGTELNNIFTILRNTGVLNFTVAPTIGGTAISLVGHTHAISDVTNLQTTLNGKEAVGVAASLVSNHEGAANPHPQYSLPSRLGAVAQPITDWNDASDNGWYMGNNATNAPAANWFIGFVEQHNPNYVTQTVHAFTADLSTDTKLWRRSKTAGSWSAWYRLRWSEAELDARYSQLGHSHAISDVTNLQTALDGIVENGSNANGYYTRFKDGTQICHLGRAGGANPHTWTFPAAFATTNNLVVKGTARVTVPRIITVSPIGTTSADVHMFTETGVAASNTEDLMAVGRW